MLFYWVVSALVTALRYHVTRCWLMRSNLQNKQPIRLIVPRLLRTVADFRSVDYGQGRVAMYLLEVKSAKICLECCPISNQVLGYCPNLANHAVLGLLRSGVTVTISPDDPGMWHYNDVSYDFAAVAKAWNLGLAELKALARNSLTYSTLRGRQRQKALEQWEAEWQQWVNDELHAAGVRV